MGIWYLGCYHVSDFASQQQFNQPYLGPVMDRPPSPALEAENGENSKRKESSVDEGTSAVAIKRRLVRPKKIRKVDEEEGDLTSSPGAGPSSPRKDGTSSPRQKSPVHPNGQSHPDRRSPSPLPRKARGPPPPCPLVPPRSSHPPLVSCRSVYNYTRLNHIEEGTYGVVFRARCNETGGIYALKKLKLEEEKQGFPITSLREVMALMVAGSHENVVGIREIVVGDTLNQ